MAGFLQVAGCMLTVLRIVGMPDVLRETLDRRGFVGPFFGHLRFVSKHEAGLTLTLEGHVTLHHHLSYVVHRYEADLHHARQKLPSS